MVPERSLTATPTRFVPRSSPSTLTSTCARPGRGRGASGLWASGGLTPCGDGFSGDAQRLGDAVGVLAAGRGDVALAPATTTDGSRRVLDQRTGRLLGARLHGGDERDAVGVGRADQHDDVHARLLAHGDGQLAQVVG